jgi:catechol 2,3-dioxygenase-like lactoylglutathione lyase family enzyme
MQIDRLDHLVLTVQSLEATCAFYTNVLGMQRVVFGDDRIALAYGEQKINLHAHGREYEPKAAHPLPGSADLCFVTRIPMADVIKHLAACGVTIIEGPVERTGARGALISVYVRDPDQNLIELSNVAETAA